MKCPRCKNFLIAWPWQDGGYRGVRCPGCGRCWWSDSFAARASEAERRAVDAVLARSKFPRDAKCDKEARR